MWTSYANFKEKVSKIALEVHDDGDEDEEELGIYGSRNGGLHDSYSNSHTFAHSHSHSHSQSLSNGIDSAFNPEVFHIEFRFVCKLDSNFIQFIFNSLLCI